MTMAMAPTSSQTHRAAALALMDRRGPILDAARGVSALLRDAHVPAVVIGGIAVVLHGHWRATRDIDLLVAPPLEPVADLLVAHGFELVAARREFVREDIPVQLVLPEQTGTPPDRGIEIEGILTASLPDLIAMKLRSGTRNLVRAQDLADVIGLIRCHALTGEFARHLDKSLRPAFRKLVRAVERESSS